MKKQIPWKYSTDDTVLFLFWFLFGCCCFVGVFFINIWRAGRQWKGVRWSLFNESLLIIWEAVVAGMLFLASFDGMTSGLMHFAPHSEQAVHGQPGQFSLPEVIQSTPVMCELRWSPSTPPPYFSDKKLLPPSGLGWWDPCEVHTCKCGASLYKPHKCSNFWWPTCERN